MRSLDLSEAKPLRSGDSLELDESIDVEHLDGPLLCLRVKGGDGLVIDDLGHWIVERTACVRRGFATVIHGTWKNPAYENLPVDLRVSLDANGGGFVVFA